jgi:serine/threonine protein kinase
MYLPPGTRLGPYKIEAPIGAGGMGEVYRATDTRLDRTVAVKILSSRLISEPNAKQRFEREAHAASAQVLAGLAFVVLVGILASLGFGGLRERLLHAVRPSRNTGAVAHNSNASRGVTRNR